MSLWWIAVMLHAEGGSASMFVLKTAAVSLDGEGICNFAALGLSFLQGCFHANALSSTFSLPLPSFSSAVSVMTGRDHTTRLKQMAGCWSRFDWCWSDTLSQSSAFSPGCLPASGHPSGLCWVQYPHFRCHVSGCSMRQATTLLTGRTMAVNLAEAKYVIFAILRILTFPYFESF